MSRKFPLNYRVNFLLAIVLTVCSCTKVAEDEFNQETVAMCVACHGADGIGKAVSYPDLQGLPVEYMVAQLEAFKSGERENSEMNTVVEPLSKKDMSMFQCVSGKSSRSILIPSHNLDLQILRI